jgi:hypothetical protein
MSPNSVDIRFHLDDLTLVFRKANPTLALRKEFKKKENKNFKLLAFYA